MLERGPQNLRSDATLAAGCSNLDFSNQVFNLINNLLRWPDTIYLHIGRLFSIHIFDHSAAFDCRDILDAEKGMLEVYQKRTFIENTARDDLSHLPLGSPPKGNSK